MTETLTPTLYEEILDFAQNECEEACREAKEREEAGRAQVREYHEKREDFASQIEKLQTENRELDKQFKQAARNKEPIIGFTNKKASNSAAISALLEVLQEQEDNMVLKELERRAAAVYSEINMLKRQKFAEIRKSVMERIGSLLDRIITIDNDWSKACEDSSISLMAGGSFRSGSGLLWGNFHETVAEMIKQKGYISCDGTNEPNYMGR